MIKDRFDVHVPSRLPRNTPIYRIIDFFSAAHLVTTNSLYIPIAERLKDPNEGIDAALDLYAVSAGPCAGITSFFKNIDEFKDYQQRQKRANYVSCWSRVRESVAMWALYSSDLSSIQITTTIGQLEDALHSYYEREHDPRSAIDSAGQKGQFIQSARIAAVRYLSIIGLSALINRRRRAYDKLESKGLVKDEMPIAKWSIRDQARAAQYQLSAFELKDVSFSHEMELRAIIEAVPYDSETLEIARRELCEKTDPTKWMDPVYEKGTLRYARAILREEGVKKRLTVPETLFLPVPENFITQVSIDPRCDPHKQEFIATFFRKGVYKSFLRCALGTWQIGSTFNLEANF